MDSSQSSHGSEQQPYNMGQSPYWPTLVSSTLAVTVPLPVEGSINGGVIYGRPGGVGVPVAALFIVAEMAGAGILNLPSAIVGTGWSGIFVIIILGIGVAFSGTRLSECWIILEEQWPEYRTVSRSPYPAIGFRAFGRTMQIVVHVVLHITILGACVVYLLLIADLLASLLLWIPDFILVTSCEAVLFVTAIVIPISWMGTPKDFWWTSIIAVASTVATLAVVLFEIGSNAGYVNHVRPDPTFNSYCLGFGSILFSLGGASMFPTIQNDMRNRDKFAHSVVIGFVCLITMYVIITATVYQLLGGDAPENVIDAISGPSVAVIQVLLIAHFLFAFIITLNPSLQAFEEVLAIEQAFGVKRVIARTLLTLLLMLVALSIPDFGKLLDLLGGSTVSMMSFIFPPIFYWRLASMKDSLTNCSIRSVPSAQKLVMICLVAVGVSGGTVSTYSALQAIVAPGALNATCFSRMEFLGY